MPSDEKIQQIFKNFFERILEEQKRFDTETQDGMFEEFATAEHMYRYLLLSPLYRAGYTSIELEKSYEKVVQRAACDIIAKSQDETLWIELKFAYSNTGYTTERLLRDVLRLNQVKQGNVGCVYCLVAITENKTLPKKIQDIGQYLNQSGISAKSLILLEKIGVPGKSWPDAQIQVVVYYW